MKRIIITAALALGVTSANARSTKRRYVLAFFQKLAPCLVGIEACASGPKWWRAREPRSIGVCRLQRERDHHQRFRDE
jgi:transposase